MAGNYTIRAVLEADRAAVEAIAVDAGMFEPDEMDDFGQMLGGYLDGTLTDHAWILLQEGERGPVGAAYYAPEPFSDRMWNLYFLAVLPEQQRAGGGAALVAHVEAAPREKGDGLARTLIIETSSLDGFAGARAFYRHIGYEEQARVREFYGPADDKIVFWKRL